MPLIATKSALSRCVLYNAFHRDKVMLVKGVLYSPFHRDKVMPSFPLHHGSVCHLSVPVTLTVSPHP